MAALYRTACSAMKTWRITCLRKHQYTPVCFISTSEKNKDTISVTEPILKPKKSETASDTLVKNKNWVSYGWEVDSERDDRISFHTAMFMSVTVALVLGGFILMYQPDQKLRDWSTREAFLELHRRETLGLPLIDPNLINPDCIELPSDEELGDLEIII